MQFPRVFDQDHAVRCLCDLGEKRVGERRLAGSCPSGNEDITAVGDGAAEGFGFSRTHDAGRHIIGEREDRDRGLTDGEGRRGDDRRQQAFKALAGFGKLGRNPRRAAMNLGADMMRNQPDDPVAIGGREREAAIGEPFAKPVDPEPAVGIEHHLDDRGVGKPFGDCAAERRLQHPGAPTFQFIPEWLRAHENPACCPGGSARLDGDE